MIDTEDPMSFLFNTAGEMISGLFNDVGVAFSALLVLGFMVLGVKILQKIFLRDETVGENEQEFRRERADEAKEF